MRLFLVSFWSLLVDTFVGISCNSCKCNVHAISSLNQSLPNIEVDLAIWLETSVSVLWLRSKSDVNAFHQGQAV